ncbi:TPA: hypothetical protein I1871_001672 [Staphylococcus pseudintermedius]|nr:hypothetical protein [Staphylococcus pseudintermedius]EJD8521216.1 hypothetical protein [Staphylococcus pseudintermedius]HAR6574029.1 hypothetical protein [Staphylococcus pseudintermedius]
MKKEIELIFLLAGQGSRLQNVTNGLNKCLVTINKQQTILNRIILQCLSHFEVKRIHFVIGYEGESLKKYINKLMNKCNFQNYNIYVNEEYENTNNLHSLSKVDFNKIEKDCLLIDGDLIVEDAILDRINNLEKTTIIVDKEIILDDEAMKIEEVEGRVTRLGKGIKSIKTLSESIGIVYLEYKIIKEIKGFFENKFYHPEEYYEYMLQNILENDFKIYTADIQGLKWVEIDDALDYKKAKNLFGDTSK